MVSFKNKKFRKININLSSQFMGFSQVLQVYLKFNFQDDFGKQVNATSEG